MKLLLLMWAMLAVVIPANSQTVSGQVVDEHNKPIADVNIIMTKGQSSTLGFVFSDAQGRFSLEKPQDKDSIEISFRLLGYKSVTLKLEEFKDKQTIVMPASAVMLKEVSVRGPRITQRGDTLSYLVSNFRQSQDRSIADVIAKMPGMEVKTSGQIFFKGKPINKFYIEDMDLMGSKYAQASENLSADKVKSVQVYQSHQPIKSKRNSEFSDQAALNIKLTDAAKNVWAGFVEVRGGLSVDGNSDALYGGKLMAMKFGRKEQNLSVYKTDHSGTDITHEISDLISDSYGNTKEMGLMGNISVGRPSLDSHRTMFNTTHMASVNHLVKLSQETNLRIQADYLWNRQYGNYYKETVYKDLVGVMITEDNHVSAVNHLIKGDITYEKNTDKVYLKNRVHGSLNFDKSDGETLLNGKTTLRNVRPHRHYLTDDFRMVLPMHGGRTVSAGSQTTYSHLPGRLLTYKGFDEQLVFDDFESNNHVSFIYPIRTFRVSYQAGFNIKSQRMHVRYNKVDALEKFSRQNLFLKAAVEYQLHDFRLKANVKVDGEHTYFDNTHCWHPMIKPTLSWSYEVNAEHSLSGTYSYSESAKALTEMFRTPTFTSYYYMESNSGPLDYVGSHNLSFKWTCQQPIKGNVFNAMFSYNHRNNNVLYNNSYKDNILVSEATGQRYSYDAFNVRASAAHSFPWAKTFVSFTPSYQVRERRMLVNSKVIHVNLNNAGLELKLSMQPADFFSYELKSLYNVSRQDIRDNSENIPDGKVTNAESTMSLFFFPHKNVEIGCVNEWYHNSANGSHNSYFLDTHASYKTQRYELRLDLYNLLGKSTYVNSIISSTTNIYSVYQLRAREFMCTFNINI